LSVEESTPLIKFVVGQLSAMVKNDFQEAKIGPIAHD
jgi:hypothetical protein